MAKRKKPEPKAVPSIDELVSLAKKVGLPAGAFDGDLEDACDDEAEIMKENVKSESLGEQLQFLHMHGYQLGRLAELIRELAKEGGGADEG